jgi:hypothetical protein
MLILFTFQKGPHHQPSKQKYYTTTLFSKLSIICETLLMAKRRKTIYAKGELSFDQRKNI